MQLRRAGRDRSVERSGGGKIAIFNVDQIARIFSDRLRLGDQHRDCFTDKPHAAKCEHRMQRFCHRSSVFTGEVHDVRQRLETRRAYVVAGEDGFHTGVSKRARGIETHDFGMCAVGAQKNRVELPGQIPVSGVTAMTGDQTMVFATRHDAFAFVIERMG